MIFFERLCTQFKLMFDTGGAGRNTVQCFDRKYQQLIEDLLDCINNRNMWVKF